MGAGYSGTPLATKLGIKDGSSLALIGSPLGIITALPSGVAVTHRAGGHADVVVAFFTRRAKLEARVEGLGKMIFPAGGLWVAWPKRTSGVDTDLDDNVIRDVVLASGMVDNKVCAIDTTWSGLRMVWRRERR
jgi:hypothetical protein